MLLTLLTDAALCCSAWPAALFGVNLLRYREPPPVPLSPPWPLPAVSVLIPARNEQANIRACLQCVLDSRDVSLEVLVLDDASSDDTAAIVAGIAENDSRVRLLQNARLPDGWNGKQHACFSLAQAASSPLLVFLDADVRLAPEALARGIAALETPGPLGALSLVSGFPHLVTVGFLERLLLPLIHFVLLGFLPMGSMRRSTLPSASAGCGQIFFARATSYVAAGGHAAIRETRHDGVRLPRLFREQGFATDLVDLTSLAEVRMYSSPREVWLGLAKNATEGLGAPKRILPLSVILALGQVFPPLLLVWSLLAHAPGAVQGLAAVATVLSLLPRLLATVRFRQPLDSALLHPLGVAILLILQWYALRRQIAGTPVTWRQRSYSGNTGSEVGEPVARPSSSSAVSFVETKVPLRPKGPLSPNEINPQ